MTESTPRAIKKNTAAPVATTPAKRNARMSVATSPSPSNKSKAVKLNKSSPSALIPATKNISEKQTKAIQITSDASTVAATGRYQSMVPAASRSTKKMVLNVGGNSKAIALPPQYAGFEHLLLDIDPRGNPDVLCDARKLSTLPATQFDAVYCSHNLEHYFRHDVQRVLQGFLHVLIDGGFAHIRVPDIQGVMRQTLERGLDIDDVLYQSAAGPIMVLDVLYGLGSEIERSGQDFFAHKTGFTQKSLTSALERAGFTKMYGMVGNLEIDVVAFKGEPSPATRALFGLPND